MFTILWLFRLFIAVKNSAVNLTSKESLLCTKYVAYMTFCFISIWPSLKKCAKVLGALVYSFRIMAHFHPLSFLKNSALAGKFVWFIFG